MQMDLIMNDATPSFLYHYTSIENLSLILSHRTIRFRQLCALNDPLEGKNADFAHAEKLVFSSSWTASELDTIPMWSLYTNLKGVRLKLPSDLFNSKNEISHGKWGAAIINSAKLSPPQAMRMLSGADGRSVLHKFIHITGPDQINYVAKEEVGNLAPVLTRTTGAGHSVENPMQGFDLSNIGLHKSKEWSFEQEWRFRIPLWIQASLSGIGLEEYCDLNQPSRDYIDVPMRQEAIDQLEVILGPKTTQGDEILVRSLLESLAPNAPLSRSQILIR